MTGFSLIIAFVVAIVLMIVVISKFKVHPFLCSAVLKVEIMIPGTSMMLLIP